MAIQLQEATLEERKIYYNEEWRREDLPPFIAGTIDRREFGFDDDGQGPRNRYNRFQSVERLEVYLKRRYPYAAYSSISYYKVPEKREGYEKAELVFDLDAKDLPVKSCCPDGKVCEICLARAKDLVLDFKDIVEDNLALRDVHYVYSGRGYHIRILDEDLMGIGDTERAFILDYLRGNIVLEDQEKTRRGRDPTAYTGGYAGIFPRRFKDILRYMGPEDLTSLGLGPRRAADLLAARARLLAGERRWKDIEGDLEKILKKETKDFLTKVSTLIAGNLDAKVTVDVKRILRLPSSLHSKVSMRCVEIRDLEAFDPLRDAVPRFVGERR